MSGARAMYGFGSRPGDGQIWQVSDRFFETAAIPVVAGRTFTDTEVANEAPFTVVSVGGAGLLWPGIKPAEVLDREVDLPGQPARHVIGVVADLRSSPVEAPEPSVYVPLSPVKFRGAAFIARTEPGVQISVPALRSGVDGQVAQTVAVGTAPLNDRLDSAVRDDRFRAVLFGTFALVALLLAAAGLYAVASFEIDARRRELGVRLALGAEPDQLRWRVVRDALTPVAMGALVGLGVSVWLAHFLQGFLHNVDARDPATLAMVVLTLLATGLAAAWLPARRASRVDPVIVLRAQ
jgi:F0F1-type ATP synthase membrane subunit c/vacuolar-type H+-ATPase subunit K